MSILETDVDSLAARLKTLFVQDIEAAIKKQLQEHSDKIIAQAARSAANSVAGEITFFRDSNDKSLQIRLVLNGKEEEIPLPEYFK